MAVAERRASAKKGGCAQGGAACVRANIGADGRKGCRTADQGTPLGEDDVKGKDGAA